MLQGKMTPTAGNISNSCSYKVDVAARGTASCRKSDCPAGAVKIAKGELRLGISVSYDGDHDSLQYKHWYLQTRPCFRHTLT